ncbi:hypothetical protein [Methanoregula sp.]|uniref:hypothetical protein n=1 Tax=Methanoregula sp. TaxID=2052170 RepID=UPI002D7E5AA3|nr:hypothetical protein [Methanoregula sp.]
MGTKKQAEKSKKLWVKVLAVVVGVVFVVLMVVSAMGSSWITSLATVKPGDTVVVDYTLKDAQGSPIMTSNQQLYTQLASQGSGIMFSKTLTLTANRTLGSGVYPIAFYTASTGWSSDNQFALFSSEYNTISAGLVGMRANTQKTISLATAKPMTQFWSADQLTAGNMSLSSIQVGDYLNMGVSSGTTAGEAASSAPTYIRLGKVTNKTADGITVDFSYPSIDVTVTSINPTSS